MSISEAVDSTWSYIRIASFQNEQFAAILWYREIPIKSGARPFSIEISNRKSDMEPQQEVLIASHHSVPIEDEMVSEHSVEVGQSERPLSKFNKALFSLVSG
jgi:hypothetical protein